MMEQIKSIFKFIKLENDSVREVNIDMIALVGIHGNAIVIANFWEWQNV